MRRLLGVLVLVGLAACGSGKDPKVSSGDRPVEPSRGEWRAIADAPSPELAAAPAVWAGSQMLVWGGGGGATYEPATDAWAPLPPAPLAARTGHTSVWSGEELLVWGGGPSEGSPEPFFADGAVLDAETWTWRPMAASPLGARSGHEAVWDGDELVVWGGIETCCPVDSIIHAPDAAAYDPAADRWRTLPDVPEPWSGDDGEALTVADEEEVLVWRRGRLGVLDDEGWRAAPQPLPTPAPRSVSTAGPAVVGYTARGEVQLWFGEGTDAMPGLAYDIDDRSWRRLAALDPAQQTRLAPAEAGAWALRADEGGLRVSRYDVRADEWTELPRPPLEPRYGATIVDAPAGLVVWGGRDNQGNGRRDGVVFGPPPASPPTSARTPTTADAPATPMTTFLSTLSRGGTWNPFPPPPHLGDVSDLLPEVEFVIADRDDDLPTDEESIFSTRRRRVVVASITRASPLLGRYSRPDGDIGVPEHVSPADPRADELFVALELTVHEHIAGAPADDLSAGVLIASEDLGRLQDAVAHLPRMVWFLGTPERTVLDPVADRPGVHQGVFPWFATIGDGGSLSFPLLVDDDAFTARTDDLSALRRAAAAGARTVTIRFDPDRDDYVQTDDGR